MSFKEELLYVIEELGEFTTKMLTHRLSIQRMHYPAYYSSLRRLEKEGLIKKKKRGKIFIVSITPKGKGLLKKRRIVGKRRIDGLSTIIIFDIPEEKSRARQGLRRYLIRHGYTLLQESVLISPSHMTNELKGLMRELDIHRNVKIIAGRMEYI